MAHLRQYNCNSQQFRKAKALIFRCRKYSGLLLVTLLIMGRLPVAQAQPTVTTLVSFQGQNPTSLTFDDHGNIFGTAFNSNMDGGGIIFEIIKGSPTMTPVVSFQGAMPVGIVIDNNGNLYGTTLNFSKSIVSGIIFEIVKDSHNIITLASFQGELLFPYISLDAQGNIYGEKTKFRSKSFSVFEIKNGSHTITALTSLDGGLASSLSFDSRGNIYGAKFSNDLTSSTIFEIVAVTHSVIILPSLKGMVSGITLDEQGNIFGISDNSKGSTLFEMVNGEHTIMRLASYDGLYGILALDKQGNIYGIKTNDGIKTATDVIGGTVFTIAKGSHTFTDLASFQGEMPGGIIIDNSGNLFGWKNKTGIKGGSVFEIR